MRKQLLVIALLTILTVACGSSSGTSTPNPLPDPYQPIDFNCPDYPEPTAGLYSWAYGAETWVLVVEQEPCDGFRDYDVLIVFREYNPSNGYYNETYDWWVGSGGCYEMRLAIWQSLQQPCAGEIWCDNPNACIEFRAMDKVTGDVVYRSYAVPGIANADYVY